MSNFKVGDKVKVKNSDRVFAIGRILAGGITGKNLAWEVDKYDSINGAGCYFDEIELVEPEPKFKVGDRVIANSGGIYKGEEFTVTEAVRSGDARLGPYYYKGDPHGHGVWQKFLTLAPREFRAGDLIRAEKDELVVAGRLSENVYSGITIQALGWPLKSLERDKFTITLVEAAPEPVVDQFPLPEEDGLYISQRYSLFRRTGDEWLSVGSGQRVNLETLKSERHWPLGLIAEPVDK